jgi:hypothetical protein
MARGKKTSPKSGKSQDEGDAGKAPVTVKAPKITVGKTRAALALPAKITKHNIEVEGGKESINIHVTFKDSTTDETLAKGCNLALNNMTKETRQTIEKLLGVKRLDSKTPLIVAIGVPEEDVVAWWEKETGVDPNLQEADNKQAKITGE